MLFHRTSFFCLAAVIAVLLFPLRALSASETFPTAVFLVNFQDNTNPLPLTRQDADQLVFSGTGSVYAFYKELSYGKALFTGTGTDPMSTLSNVFETTLSINTTCNNNLIFDEVVKKFSGTVNFQNYKQVIVISAPPPAGCHPRGGASSGKITTPSGTITVSYAWLAAYSYATMLADSATLHEVGHRWTEHSNAYDCGNLAFAAAANCTHIGYGNPYDVMGTGMGHFVARYKEVAGWLEPSNVLTITQDGDYTIEALEIASPTPKLLKILIGATSVFKWFDVDYRQPIGLDANLVGNMFRGASVYYVEGNRSDLLDTTPGSKPYSIYYDSDDMRDGALEPVELQIPGKPPNIFRDLISGVTLTTHLAYMPDGVTRDPNRITVRVAGVPPPPPCVRNAPLVTLQNIKVVGGPGTTFSSQVSVRNQDYLSCAPSTFSLLVPSPNGWSGSFNPITLTINPQASATTTLSLTSPPNAADGVYPLVVTANNDNAVGYSGSADTFYLVDDKPPTVAITAPGSNQSVKGTVNVAISAADNVLVGYVELFVDGKRVGFGWASPYSVAWNTATWSNGAHILQATALDGAGLKTTSVPVTVYVNNPPTVTGFWPGSFEPGTMVLVFGSNFVPIPNATKVAVNGISHPIVHVFSNTMLAFLPTSATGPITVTTTAGSATSSSSFGIPLTGLQLTGTWPGQAKAGSFVFVFGSGFDPAIQKTKVSINGLACPMVQVIDPTLLIFYLPAGAVSGPVTVAVNGQTASTPLTILP